MADTELYVIVDHNIDDLLGEEELPGLYSKSQAEEKCDNLNATVAGHWYFTRKAVPAFFCERPNQRESITRK